MPELPEVETVRRGLEARVIGRRIAAVRVGRERTVRRTSREAVISGLTGVTVTAVRRRGKYLILDLDSGWAAMVHLRMSGQLLLADRGKACPPHTHIALEFDDADEDLLFVDPRTFGEVVVFDPDDVERDLPELARLGVDPIADDLTVADVRRALGGRRRRVKPLLLDQHVIAGIGNIYADEILHRARLHPDRLASDLTAAQVRRLHASILEVLTAAIDAGGSSLRDAQYVDVMGVGGTYQHHHRVYGRAGEMCLTCGRSRVVRRTEGGRGTHLCPWCQRRRRGTRPSAVQASVQAAVGDRGPLGPTR